MSPSPRGQLPESLTKISSWHRLHGDVPALIVTPSEQRARDGAKADPQSRPLLIWMHGRTVNKELDPGRYSRLARAGIATCAIDLPGHGERFDPQLQAPEATLEVVRQAASELDGIVQDVVSRFGFALDNIAVGGMSAGGMVTMVRLCQAHQFRAALVECSTGSWRYQSHRAMWDGAAAETMDPIRHLVGWREVPFLALHNSGDQWVDVRGIRDFVSALRDDAAHPERILLHEYTDTGAPAEHAGFGRFGAEAKDRGAAFLTQALVSGSWE